MQEDHNTQLHRRLDELDKELQRRWEDVPPLRQALASIQGRAERSEGQLETQEQAQRQLGEQISKVLAELAGLKASQSGDVPRLSERLTELGRLLESVRTEERTARKDLERRWEKQEEQHEQREKNAEERHARRLEEAERHLLGVLLGAVDRQANAIRERVEQVETRTAEIPKELEERLVEERCLSQQEAMRHIS